MGKYNHDVKTGKDAAYLSRVKPGMLDDLKDKIIDILLVQKKYKDKNYTARALCEELNLSAVYVSATINLNFHMNYSDLVHKYRIEQAMSLLVDSRYENLRMEEISDMVGFNNIQSFYPIFRKIVGCTPLQYKKEYRIRHTKSI